jgi:hypothetical protein
LIVPGHPLPTNSLSPPAPEDTRAAAQAVCSSAGALIQQIRGGEWAGTANELSPSHIHWDIIDDAAQATTKPSTLEPPALAYPNLPPLAGASRQTAAALIRARRSAVSFDGKTSISSATLYAMLDHLLHRPGVPPWDAIPWPPHIHPILFVHRVRGLSPGLYALERSPDIHERLRAALSHPFDWERPSDCPDHLPFYRLVEADLRDTSQIVSCHQDIAADGAYSLGMVADFAGSLQSRGAPFYRRLFWEAGVLGHVLYLEAEAAEDSGGKIRATGIGCYFDDAFHEVCGIAGDDFQSLYHFTAGGPVEDTRLSTFAPYAHLGPVDRGPSDSHAGGAPR